MRRSYPSPILHEYLRCDFKVLGYRPGMTMPDQTKLGSMPQCLKATLGTGRYILTTMPPVGSRIDDGRGAFSTHFVRSTLLNTAIRVHIYANDRGPLPGSHRLLSLG